MPNGSKLWRMKYRFAGKERRLAIGKFPEVSLADAREAKAKARKQLAENIDPSTAKRAEKAQLKEDSFEALAAEWQLRQASKWTPGYAEEVQARIGNNLIPWLGASPINKITAPELLACLRRMGYTKAEMTGHGFRGMASTLLHEQGW